MNAAGRVCPLRYRYGAATIATAPERLAETLYVVGGLYGNTAALDALLAMADAEPGPVTLCFNGDFNWFNVDDAGFDRVNTAVLKHDAILGNVEAELQPEADDAGCGCAYPDTVDADVVARSNQIHARLKATAARHPAHLAKLATLPMFARYRIGALRVGVVHGDANALAGWDFDVSRLNDASHRAGLTPQFHTADVDVFASSHTCLPVCRQFADGKVLINNGAAGMPNFSGTQHGILTRISRHPCPHPVLYGVRVGAHRIEALALHHDVAAWQADFIANWPPGSPANQSYFDRIANGPIFTLAQAAPG
ncbi:hypothetical protein [Denitromonas ohlonensis]|uniref:Metallophosphoesterase family protein n=2 Tax=Denitromonas TaxID=139331 RepID=A0A557RVD2_9RHOO|nr:hypothetical protein [Denitromonas ohlonensis]TVO69099.1 hypothetical protein FHP90_00430 [Denitromonas ohlonensis]TVO77199.1 hypothetical protein FHP89_07660 [Denitromonas ohlonensis]